MNSFEFMSMLRPELVCFAVLAFVQAYAYFYKKTTARIFRTACWAAMAHLLFDMVTVVTVNSLDTVPEIVNRVCHLALYVTALIFCYIYLEYIASLILDSRTRRVITVICRVIIVGYIIASPFMPVTYTESTITNYSGGLACYLVMGTAYLLFVISMLLLLIRHRRTEKYVFVTTVATTAFMMLCVTLQFLIPTFLFTGCGISVVTIGMFFAIENPAKYYQRRAFIDLSTGIKNKNCFTEDIKALSAKCENGKELRLTAAVCDINYLKLTNDTYGHLEGDELIRNTALLLSKCFRSEYSVYRVGGDEFIALFLNKDRAAIEEEIKQIHEKSREIAARSRAPLSLAIGFAELGELEKPDITELISLADKRMYEEKTRMKENGTAGVKIERS